MSKPLLTTTGVFLPPQNPPLNGKENDKETFVGVDDEPNHQLCAKPQSDVPPVRIREPLSNISNSRNNKESGFSFAGNSSKRSASVLLETQSLSTESSKYLNQNSTGMVPLQKKRRSDPMILTEVNEEMDNGQAWENIDTDDYDDPQACVVYVNDIYQFLMEKEKTECINPKYMEDQPEISEKMRAILVDWLVEVHRMFKLLPETLFLCINIIDRYLEAKPVPRDNLQLVGITSMFVASKYEEIYAPECNDFVYISDGSYTKEQILSMEQLLLNTLDFRLTHPSPLHFLRRYSKAAGSDYVTHTLCKYLIELMLIDVKLLKYTTSQIAAGSVFIARLMGHLEPTWTPTLQHYSTYSEAEIRVVALDMNNLLKRSQKSSLKAIKKKYSTSKFGEVANLQIVDF